MAKFVVVLRTSMYPVSATEKQNNPDEYMDVVDVEADFSAVFDGVLNFYSGVPFSPGGVINPLELATYCVARFSQWDYISKDGE